jgi:hypothetical protein
MESNDIYCKTRYSAYSKGKYDKDAVFWAETGKNNKIVQLRDLPLHHSELYRDMLKQHDTLTSFGSTRPEKTFSDRSRVAKDDISVHTSLTELSLSQNL